MTTVNVLLTTFPGLDLPRTLSVPISPLSTLADLHRTLSSYLPSNLSTAHLQLTTTTSHRLPCSPQPLTTLLPPASRILPLQLRAPTRGGKGGFGSQLRAAGGRMSSSKKRRGAPPPSSNRNLDGRRLRTIDEAKKLTEYLAVKPEMERQEKEEKYKRWTRIVEESERKEREMREGKGRRGDGKWIEEKEDQERWVREAVERSLREVEKNGGIERRESDESGVGSEGSSDGGIVVQSNEDGAGRLEEVGCAEVMGDVKGKAKKVWGWDDEDEDEEDDSDEAD